MHYFLESAYRYTIAGIGHCKDWVYLPEGGYPQLLDDSKPLYNVDRIQECMNRCVHAADNGLIGSQSSGDTKIRDLAFSINLSNQRCGCSSGECSVLTPDHAFRSFYIVQGNYEALW